MFVILRRSIRYSLSTIAILLMCAVRVALPIAGLEIRDETPVHCTN